MHGNPPRNGLAYLDGTHSIGVQNVTSNCNVAMLIVSSSPYIYLDVLLLERLSFAGKIYENRFLAFKRQ